MTSEDTGSRQLIFELSTNGRLCLIKGRLRAVTAPASLQGRRFIGSLAAKLPITVLRTSVPTRRRRQKGAMSRCHCRPGEHRPLGWDLGYVLARFAKSAWGEAPYQCAAEKVLECKFPPEHRDEARQTAARRGMPLPVRTIVAVTVPSLAQADVY